MMTKQYGEIRFSAGYQEGREQGKKEADELRLGCCDDVYLKGYDAGLLTSETLLKAEWENEKVEIYDAARLKGFEEGYDEAKEVFDPEGGYADVKVQAYDRGFRDGQDNVVAAVEAGKLAAQNWAREIGGGGLVERKRHGGHGC